MFEKQHFWLFCATLKYAQIYVCIYICVCCRFFLKQMKRRKDSWPEQISKLRWFPFWVIVHQQYALYVVSISPAFSTLSVTDLVVEKVWYLIFKVILRSDRRRIKLKKLPCTVYNVFKRAKCVCACACVCVHVCVCCLYLCEQNHFRIFNLYCF